MRASGSGLNQLADGWNNHFSAKHDGVFRHAIGLLDGGGGDFVFRADAGKGVSRYDGVNDGGTVGGSCWGRNVCVCHGS